MPARSVSGSPKTMRNKPDRNAKSVGRRPQNKYSKLCAPLIRPFMWHLFATLQVYVRCLPCESFGGTPLMGPKGSPEQPGAPGESSVRPLGRPAACRWDSDFHGHRCRGPNVSSKGTLESHTIYQLSQNATPSPSTASPAIAANDYRWPIRRRSVPPFVWIWTPDKGRAEPLIDSRTV